MKKTALSAVCAVLLIVTAALCGAWFQKRRAPAPAPAVSTQASAAQTDVPAAATTQQTVRTTAAETTTVPATAAATSARGTYTDLFPLPAVLFTVSDPDNTRALSTTRIDHSFGIAKDGKPNAISVETQQRFDRSGKHAVAYDNRTQESALYLTFDCGYENGNTATILDVLQQKQVPAAFFCTLPHIRSQPELIARMIREGHTVGNHSDTHPDFSKISRTQMAQELQAVENALREQFGYSSSYFRFPEGAYSESALDLVDSLGYTSVFWSCAYADWDTQNTKGKQYALETVTSRLHPGAIILLHAVSPDNAAAMADIIDTARNLGYTFRPLADYGQ